MSNTNKKKTTTKALSFSVRQNAVDPNRFDIIIPRLYATALGRHAQRTTAYRYDGRVTLEVGCQNHSLETWSKRGGTIFDRVISPKRPSKTLAPYARFVSVYDQNDDSVQTSPTTRRAIARDIRAKDVAEYKKAQADKKVLLATLKKVTAQLAKPNPITPVRRQTTTTTTPAATL